MLHLISGGDTGGAKTHVISLVKELNRIIDTRIICFMDGVFHREALEAGIDIEVLEQKSRMDLSIIGRIRDEIEQKGYDLIHCHGARANFIGAILKELIDIPIITTIHSDYKLDFKDNSYKRLIYTPLNALALKRLDYYMAVSDAFKSMLIDRNFAEDRIFTIYNGVDMDALMDYISRDQFLQRYGIEGNERVIIGIMGRLDQVKDHKTFIRAAAKILEHREDALFLIAGTGNDEARLKKMVIDMDLEEHIHFLGFVEDEYSFFNAIDINVLTSISESFPYVLLEGARLKKPTISTDVGGIHRLIEDGYSGYLIEVGDWESLAKNIISLMGDEDRMSIMGKNLYETLRLNFSARKMAEEHHAIYEQILDIGGRGYEGNR